MAAAGAIPIAAAMAAAGAIPIAAVAAAASTTTQTCVR
jgi:hypothetical protein